MIFRLLLNLTVFLPSQLGASQASTAPDHRLETWPFCSFLYFIYFRSDNSICYVYPSLVKAIQHILTNDISIPTVWSLHSASHFDFVGKSIRPCPESGLQICFESCQSQKTMLFLAWSRELTRHAHLDIVRWSGWLSVSCCNPTKRRKDAVKL